MRGGSRFALIRRLVTVSTAAALVGCGGDGSGIDEATTAAPGGETTIQEPTPGEQAATDTVSASDDESAIRDVVVGYLGALADGRYDEACGYLGDEALAHLAQQPTYEGTCEDTLATTFGALSETELGGLRDVEITSVEVNGDRATATVQGATAPIPLVRTDDGWKIAQLAF